MPAPSCLFDLPFAAAVAAAGSTPPPTTCCCSPLLPLPGSAPCPPLLPLLQVLEFSKDEEGQLVARMLRQAVHGVEVTRRVYPKPAPPAPAPEPERPSTPTGMDAGAPSFA
jgi:hypothetical protein